ncbi:MAG: MoaD/ThiS family protein [Bacteroidia bacterium]
MTVLFFGPLAEITGSTKIEFDHTPDTATLMEQILLRFPALKRIKVQLALNQEVVTESKVITEGDELALLAPFAGG